MSFFLLILVLVLIGLAAGLLAGLLGIGGGIIFTPVLFLLFADAGVTEPVLWTIGSSLFCTFIAAAGSSVRQYRQKNFFLREGATVGVLGAVGVTFGKEVATSSFYGEVPFAIFFSLILLYVAWMFFRRRNNIADDKTGEEKKLNVLRSGITGGAGGFIAALAGIGGGGVMVPIMNLGYKIPFKKAVSISSLAIVIISLSGWFQLAALSAPEIGGTGYSMGFVDFGMALPLALAGLAGGFVGAMLNLRIRKEYLQIGFAMLAIVMAGKLLWEVL